MSRFFYSIAVLITALLWGILFMHNVAAYYNFMAPGVPPRAICKADFGEKKIDVLLESTVSEPQVGDEFEIVVTLQNVGEADASISALQIYVFYPIELVKATSIKVNQDVLCGVSLDETKTYVDPDQGVVSVFADQLEVDGCNPIDLPQGESVELIRIPFTALNEGAARIYVDSLDSQQLTAVYDFSAPDINVVNKLGEVTVNVGGAEVPPPDTLTTTVTETTTPTPTATTTPPPTGVMDVLPPLVALVISVGGFLIYYIDRRHNENDGKILLD